MKKTVRVFILLFAFLFSFAFCFLGGGYKGFSATASGESAHNIRFNITVNNKTYTFYEKEISGVYDKAFMEKYGRAEDKHEKIKYIKQILRMGFSKKDAICFVFPGFASKLAKIKKENEVDVTDASFKFNVNKPRGFDIINHQKGMFIDENRLYTELFNQLLIPGNTVNIKAHFRIINPTVLDEDVANFTSLKASFSTYYGASVASRKNNIKVAVLKINGSVIMPGETFSFNNTTGVRNSEAGYLPAKIIVNNEYTEDYGGGVCQVSTTLYNAALLAGLSIIQVHPHSLKPAYVPVSFDAMVSGRSLDFRFKNNTDGPIFIRASADGVTCRMEVFGEKNKYTIKRRSELLDYDYKNTDIAAKSKGFLDYYDAGGKLLFSRHVRADTYKKVKITPVFDFAGNGNLFDGDDSLFVVPNISANAFVG